MKKLTRFQKEVLITATALVFLVPGIFLYFYLVSWVYYFFFVVLVQPWG